MSTTKDLKDNLLQTFYDTIGCCTMNFEQMEIFLNVFFAKWGEDFGELHTDAEVKEMCERAYWDGRDDEREGDHAM